MSRFFVTILVNALGIWLAGRLVSGFNFDGNILELVGAGAILAALNWTIRPLARLITGPLIVITFGLFIVVINAAMLWLLDLLVPTLLIVNLAALLLATLIMTALNIIISPLKKTLQK